MIIIGCDYHPSFQQIAFVDTETGELQERRLQHREEAEKFYRDLAAQGMKVRVGMEASGHARWFERLLAELQCELCGKMRDEFLNCEIFYSLKEAQILTERWRVEYNTERPHSALNYRPPGLQAILPKQEGHGDMENALRFPHPHPSGDSYGQLFNKALHQHSTWYKRPVRSLRSCCFARTIFTCLIYLAWQFSGK
jgi:hypothetical protein